MLNRRQWLACTAAAAAAGSLPLRAQAQSKPVRLLVGATPGGGTDIVARAVAMAMEKPMGATLVVENRPGAAGNIAASAVAGARGDSSTLLLAYTSHAINPSMMKSMPFDPLADFTPISLLATSPLLLVANSKLPVKDLPGLITHARTHDLSIGVTGLGSASQLAGAMLQHRTGMKLVNVPYKGAAPALQDQLGGQIDLVMSTVATARPFLQSGQIRALAVTMPERLSEYPEVAPVAELVPGFDFSSWYGLLGPAGMSAADVAKLEAAARSSAHSEAVRSRLSHDGLRPAGTDGAEFRRFLEAQIERFAEVVRVTGVGNA